MKPYAYMSNDEICQYMIFTDVAGCLKQLFIIVIFIGFLLIVVTSKRYRPKWDKFVEKYLKWM